MELPLPTTDFSIPSLHDRTPLKCRIYDYRNRSNCKDSKCMISGAILAHPYAPLGGSYDDPVVGVLTRTLVKLGFVIGTFNFRGASGSKGSTSWTGKAEIVDYVSFVGFFVEYLRIKEARNEHSRRKKVSINLLLGGYSYGSLITRHLPDLRQIMARFEGNNIGTVELEILDIAFIMTTSQVATHGDIKLTKQENPPSDGINAAEVANDIPSSNFLKDDQRSIKSRTKLRAEPIDISPQYLLISPVLPPLAWILGDTAAAAAAAAAAAGTLSSHPTLVAIGDSDGFTSSGKARALAQRYRTELAVIPGAGHFWREPGAIESLNEKIQAWIEAISTRT